MHFRVGPHTVHKRRAYVVSSPADSHCGHQAGARLPLSSPPHQQHTCRPACHATCRPAQAAAIQQEFVEVTGDPDLARKGNNIWVPAVRGDATGYGDDWRTLVLQARVGRSRLEGRHKAMEGAGVMGCVGT